MKNSIHHGDGDAIGQRSPDSTVPDGVVACALAGEDPPASGLRRAQSSRRRLRDQVGGDGGMGDRIERIEKSNAAINSKLDAIMMMLGGRAAGFVQTKGQWVVAARSRRIKAPQRQHGGGGARSANSGTVKVEATPAETKATIKRGQFLAPVSANNSGEKIDEIYDYVKKVDVFVKPPNQRTYLENLFVLFERENIKTSKTECLMKLAVAAVELANSRGERTPSSFLSKQTADSIRKKLSEKMPMHAVLRTTANGLRMQLSRYDKAPKHSLHK